MNWDKEVEVEGNHGAKAVVTVGDLHSMLLGELTTDELEEFAEELVCPGQFEGDDGP
jgi:hypothetical protein